MIRRDYEEGGTNLALMARWRGWSVDFEWGTENHSTSRTTPDPFDREGWRVSLGWFVVPAKWEIRARYAEIQRLKNPTYQKAVNSGLGIPEVWDGEDWTHGARGQDLGDHRRRQCQDSGLAQQARHRSVASDARVRRGPRMPSSTAKPPPSPKRPTRSTTEFAPWSSWCF